MPGRRAAAGLDVRTTVLAPGDARAYDAGEWRDAIVIVGLGELELESLGGARSRFARGAVLWLARLSLRALRNPGTQPTLLIAVARRPRPER
jgi:hypothetical protein